MTTNRKLLIVLVLFVGMLAFAGIYSLAQTDGQIYACVLKDGTLRIVPDGDQCKRNETLLTLNLTGLQGPQGPQGDPGSGSRSGNA
jgi:hypothetical protein